MIETQIELSVPAVFAYDHWRRFSSFPQYFHSVKSVVGVPEGAMTWTIDILGVERSFDVRVTQRIPGARLAWATTAGTEHSGAVTFHELAGDHCSVKLQMDFNADGLAEQLADKTQLARLAVDFELGAFKAVVESAYLDLLSDSN